MNRLWNTFTETIAVVLKDWACYSSFEFAVFEEVRQESFVFVDVLRCEFDLVDDLLGIFQGEVGEFDVFDLVPASLDDVEFGRVRRQPLEAKPIRMFAFIFRLQTLVTLQVVPDNDDLALEMFVQFVEHVRHLGGLRAAGKYCRKELHFVADRRDRNQSDGRKMCSFFRLHDNVRHADR